MFGVAEDLDLSSLAGKKLQQISVGEQCLELAFEDDWRISIECPCRKINRHILHRWFSLWEEITAAASVSEALVL